MEVDDLGEVVEGMGGSAQGVEAGRVDALEGDSCIKRLIDPRLPTEEEVEHHKLTHLPYRSWCPECVKAKGKDLDYRCAVDNERKLPAPCFDYCFP